MKDVDFMLGYSQLLEVWYSLLVWAFGVFTTHLKVKYIHKNSIKTFCIEKVCPEIEEIPNGKIFYGEGYNATIPDGTVAEFSCNEGTDIFLNFFYLL